MAESSPDIDSLEITELKALVLQLLEKGAARDVEIASLRAEVCRLKGLSGPPNIKPSGMDKNARNRAKAGRAANRKRRGSKKNRVRIDEKRIVEAEVPSGSRFKGYEGIVKLTAWTCRWTQSSF